MPLFRDQLGNEIELNGIPGRIISVVPSQTEFLYDIGMKDNIVGQTIFCIHPRSHFKTAKKIGGTKKLRLDEIAALKPDLIIANKEENELSQISELQQHFPVWISDIKTFADAVQMMTSLGEICGKQIETELIIQKINNSFSELENNDRKKRVLYLIWNEPWMAAGRDTFIHEMITMAGFENAIVGKNSRYPEISIEDVKSLQPDYVFLSSEPFPFNEKHVKEWNSLFPEIKTVIVDGEMFSWYGSRMILAAEYFKKLNLELTAL